MQAELLDIRNHIAQYPPFDEMAEDLLDHVVEGIEVVYFRAGTQILELGQQNAWLHYLRSGAVETSRRSGELYNRLGEGEFFVFREFIVRNFKFFEEYTRKIFKF